MENVIIDLALVLLGLVSGAMVNVSIYAFAVCNPRPVSPWQTNPGAIRFAIDRVPVLGWVFLGRESRQFGRLHWLRPMLIEAGFAVGFPMLWRFVAAGGLTDSALAAPPIASAIQAWVWFGTMAALVSLLAAATFIDLDEKTIPDALTLPGTLLALAIAWVFPIARLPELILLNPGVRVESLNYCSPQSIAQWHQGTLGLLAAAAVVLIWMAALLPLRIRWRRGRLSGFRLMWLSLVRPRRRTNGLAAPRQMFFVSRMLLVLAAVLVILTTAAWMAGDVRWDSFFSQLMGLAFGGGLVWAVRIIAGHALGQEAMGFGDVTLMAMIGAFVGWQPALLIFCFAPFAALLIAILQIVVSRRPDIAFGPYLSLAAVFVWLQWATLWNDWARNSVFILGPILLIVTFVCLVLMAVMLSGWQWLKQRFDPAE